MGFDELHLQPLPLHPEAGAYAEKALELAREAAARTRHAMDIAYGNEDRQRLDVYLPEDQSRSEFPTLVFLHGGRWRAGCKEWNALLAPSLVKFPAILVSPSYGLSPDYRFPIPLHDVLQSVSWTYRHIAEFGGASNRIFIGGHSAGGHLAALAVTRRDLHAQYELPDNVFKACFPMSGTMNFDFDEALPGSEEEQIRRILLADEKDAVAASPLRHVKGNKTPFYLTFGENDFPRVVATNREMIAALDDQAGACRWHQFASLGHFDVHLGLQDPDNPWFEVVGSWMKASAGCCQSKSA